MMHPILVTGGCGFIGSNLVRLLLGQGYPVVNVDCLTYAGNPQSLEDIQDHPGYRFQRVDLTEAAALETVVQAHRPRAILHLAAESHVDRSIDGPGQFIQTNVVGTYHLLQAALRLYRSLPAEEAQAFRLVHVSTDEVYGSLGAEGLFTESTRYDPHSPYSASKAASDHLARAWGDTYGLPVIVTNCSNNYGPYQFPEKLIPVVILKCLRHEPIPVYGRGENIRDWLYVEDHCRALQCVLERGRPGETYNIGGNNEMRNIELVRELCRIMDELHPRADGLGYAEQITFVQDRPGHDLRYAIDASKIARELGWSPQQDRHSGFRATVAWYLEHEAWWQAILSGSYQLERLGAAVG
jgi:dTDP-glucose 4,6-dehydratase